MTKFNKCGIDIEKLQICEIEKFLNNEDKNILHNLYNKVFKAIEENQLKFFSDIENGNINAFLNKEYQSLYIAPKCYAKVKLRYILENNTWDEITMKEFQDLYSSAHNFGLFFPLLRIYRSDSEVVNGYFKEPITVNGRLYLLTNMWKDNNISYLDIWLKKQNIKY